MDGNFICWKGEHHHHFGNVKIRLHIIAKTRISLAGTNAGGGGGGGIYIYNAIEVILIRKYDNSL